MGVKGERESVRKESGEGGEKEENPNSLYWFSRDLGTYHQQMKGTEDVV